MSVQEAEQASDAVVTGDDAGTEVWCPHGHGNRFLEDGEKIGFACPQCKAPMTVDKPESVQQGETKKVRLPEVGRIVHVLLDNDTVRPGIVCGRTDDGRCLVDVRRHSGDPVPVGSGIGGSDPAILVHGDGVGQWHWPPKEPVQDFDAIV